MSLLSDLHYIAKGHLLLPRYVLRLKNPFYQSTKLAKFLRNSTCYQQYCILQSFEEGRISLYSRRIRSRGTFENSGIGEDSVEYFLQFVSSIFGDKIGGRFGSAITSVGDLDGDGKQDLVVGSPYEDEGMGAVRVFYGKGDLTRLNGMSSIRI